MRIVKLSQSDVGFNTIDDVRRFFLDEIRTRAPRGKFAVTAGRIAQDGLRPDEPLVFTYQARVVFTALAASALLPNDVEDRATYPHYFLVSLETLQECNESLRDVERRYKEATGEDVNLVETQAWIPLSDSSITEALFAALRETFPEEVFSAGGLPEGAVHRVTVNAYERNPEARRRCIERYGARCCVCDFNFGATYGSHGEGFIHVHHLRSLREVGREYIVDPIKDLRPVCPNCHAMLHRRVPPFSIEDIQQFLRRSGA